MTVSELIARTGELKPNPYNEKLESFIKSFELRIKSELLSENSPVYDRERLALEAPFDTIYLLYLFALIDYLNGDYLGFDNTAGQFNREWDRLARHFFEKQSHLRGSIKLW